MILGEELRRAAVASENEALAHAVDEAKRQRAIDSERRPHEVDGVLAHAEDPGSSWEEGPRQKILMRMRVQRRNHGGLLEDLMEPVARQARRRAAEMLRDAA